LAGRLRAQTPSFSDFLGFSSIFFHFFAQKRLTSDPKSGILIPSNEGGILDGDQGEQRQAQGRNDLLPG